MKRVLAVLASVVILATALIACGPAAYSSCEEAREAGAAPLHQGESRWNPKLDRDGDGVACE